MAKTYLDEGNIDDLGRMLTALLSELWIVRDRMAVTERLLADKGVVSGAEIDDYRPSPEVSEDIEALRDRMVAAVVGAPLAARDRGVSAILARAGMARPLGGAAEPGGPA